jgi:hypothetical protein
MQKNDTILTDHYNVSPKASMYSAFKHKLYFAKNDVIKTDHFNVGPTVQCIQT